MGVVVGAFYGNRTQVVSNYIYCAGTVLNHAMRGRIVVRLTVEDNRRSCGIA